MNELLDLGIHFSLRLLQTDRNNDVFSISSANENFLQVSRKRGTKVLMQAL